MNIFKNPSIFFDFWKFENRKNEKSKNRKNQIFPIFSWIFQKSKKYWRIQNNKIFFEKIFFRKNIFRSKKISIVFFFDETFSEHHVRQPTLIRDASRAPRSDVAALRRKGNHQNPGFGAKIPILARLGQAEQLTIPATTVQRISEAGLSRDGYLGFSGEKKGFLFCKRVFYFSPL